MLIADRNVGVACAAAGKTSATAKTKMKSFQRRTPWNPDKLVSSREDTPVRLARS
jgi:hypothetical protein